MLEGGSRVWTSTLSLQPMRIVRQPETKNREGQLLTISLPVTLKRVPPSSRLIAGSEAPTY